MSAIKNLRSCFLRMYKKCCCVCCLLLFVGCSKREAPSPVVLKIDNEYGHSSIGDYSSGDYSRSTAPVNPSQPSARSSQSSSVHEIRNGQTLFDIAYMYNIDPTNLAKINNISPPYKVRNGQILKLPDNKYVDPAPVLRSDEMYKGENLDENVWEPAAIRKEAEVEMSTAEQQAQKSHEPKRQDDSKDSSKRDRDIANDLPIELSQSAPKEERKAATQTPTSTAKNSGKLMMPVTGVVISKFGDMRGGFANEGMNIRAAGGSPVKASQSGTVIYVGNGLEEDYGNVIIVQHSDELVTSYAHLSKILAKKGDAVRIGDVIGEVGNTGNVKEPQLYFEVLKNSVPVNPKPYLR